MDEVGNTFNQLPGFLELKQIGDKHNPFKRRLDFGNLVERVENSFSKEASLAQGLTQLPNFPGISGGNEQVVNS